MTARRGRCAVRLYLPSCVHSRFGSKTVPFIVLCLFLSSVCPARQGWVAATYTGDSVEDIKANVTIGTRYLTALYMAFVGEYQVGPPGPRAVEPQGKAGKQKERQ
eukprot:SAG22_NODE_301_length_12744_cov_19.648189_17_plen_105_part_00